MVNKLNIEFQAETFRLHKLRSSINTSCRTILGFFIKREKIKNKNVSDIDVTDPSNYLPIEKIYFGAKAESIYLQNTDKISNRDLQQFGINILNFYVELMKQMLNSFLSNSSFRNLELLEALDPENVNMEKPLSIIPLALRFPNIIPENDHEALNMEWRELTIEDSNHNTEKEPELFWYYVSNEKVGEKFRYPLLSKLTRICPA